MDDKGRKEIPFSGKWMTGEPATIGMNFRTLTNLRYADTHVKTPQGMTKINANVMDATYLKARNAFHFKKSQPAESHVLVQAYNAGLTASQVLDNTTAIPNAGEFSATELWTDSAGAGRGFFSNASDGQVIYANGVDTCMWGGVENKIGALILTTTALTSASTIAVSPKDFTDQANNTKTDSENVFTCGSTYKTFLVGSTRPAKGAKIYVVTANTTANTLAVSESTTDAWTALSVTSDGTRTGGTTSFAQTGTISWASTVATTKPKYLNGYYLYWYQFTIDAGSAAISRITLDLPFQPILDMWDGVYRDISKYYVMVAGIQRDDSTKVLADDYDVDSPETYSSLASLTHTTEYLEIGFGEKMTSLFFDIPSGYNSDQTAGLAVYYWDGGAYVSCGGITDGTSTGGVSFSKSGVVSWQNTGLALEQKKQYANSSPLYYYKIVFNAGLGTVTRLNYVAGIPASKTISYYKFPIYAQGRTLLCCDQSGDKNKAMSSSKFMPQVYNGDDSVDVYFGEEGELTCGTELFSQFGSSLYSLILMFKNNETWVVAGQDIEQWADNTFLLSSSIGCADPLTLKTINLHAEPGAGVNRALAIWRGPNGVYMSDGRAPIPIHGDIKEYFDPESSLYIPSDGTADAFIDPVKQEYHLLLDATTEVVYDIARNKWFKFSRGSNLRCGVTVHDTAGNAYCYGFIDTGYMERLENGTTFDGTAITSEAFFGDMPLGGLDIETRVSDVTLFTVAKTNDVTCTHYGDTSSTGTAKTMDHTDTNRLAMPAFDEKLNGYFHSLKYSTTGPFEPIATVVWFHAL